MAATKIGDIIVPEVFIPYVTEKTAELSAFVKSGIIVPDARLDALAMQGGKLINMPFYTDLAGDDEVLSDSGSLTAGAIGTGKDIAALLQRGRAWGVNDLAKALSGDDPMAAIGNLVAEYWARREQAILIATLGGVFLDNINDSSDHINDIAIEEGTAATEANLIGAEAIIDASTLLGDNANMVVAIAMHSKPYSRLQKLNLIDFEPTNTQNIGFGTYLGKTVIVDDTMPKTAGSTDGYKYTSYIFAKGAIGRGEGMAPVPFETDRDSLAGTDYMIHRRHFILHPRGIAFQSDTITGTTPSNTNLALAANWDRVYESKNVRITSLVTNG